MHEPIKFWSLYFVRGFHWFGAYFYALLGFYNCNGFIEEEMRTAEVEPCAGVIVSVAAARQSILVVGGAALTVKFSNFAYLF